MTQKTKDNLLMIVLGIIFIINMMIIFGFNYSTLGLVITGLVILGIGILVFILSVYTLYKKGRKSVVDSGIYSIVRHPMYLGAMIMFFSHIFFNHSLVVIFDTIIALVCCYLIMVYADLRNIEIFGVEYKVYMKQVPRMNFVKGIINILRRK